MIETDNPQRKQTVREKEIQLLKRIKEGDDKAYIELTGPYRERLYRKAVSMVKDGDDAEDIVQDALISGYRSIRNFRAESGVYTWLYRIVVNKSKDLLAKRKRARENSMDDSEFQVTDDRISFEKKVELSDESNYLINKINELEDIYKEVIELRYFEEMSYSQIAEILGTNIGTVKSRLFKAKEFLKHLIMKDGKGEGFFR
ncbi:MULTISPECIES: RNA polymerase sigma factor [Leptospira]|uniref:RNA polymerase sigma factor n=1 Tax=Leptospira licerasiae str. MMD4847 TaxID=1049971 RepID=A0ABN0H6R1_9LEPT|nr:MULTISPECIES: sigma-70 family RNA polymerase sigma factor [Leptospira]EIE00835.1 putative sigma E factor negative regulatory protein RpoE [Leptospira licerasiae serovar Varillal str. VAR 010]EJZ41130.1 putative sigma E factor negative regulatory protein RpoE [Leptospira licerasiae str. MMD4847]TGK05741.1 sigma-70 family RNA polymerase sigma factor [Leptospira selangorensis]TGM89352.1 sigma-70 family RNA polymerase sigma factor [Leptospira licerasiae]